MKAKEREKKMKIETDNFFRHVCLVLFTVGGVGIFCTRNIRKVLQVK